MKLYYSVGACSLSPHIVLRELDLPFDLAMVNLKTGELKNGGFFKDINPKGYVPALELDDGQLLTEGAVIVQYLADLRPGKKLLPPPGTMERVRCQEWLSYIGTELHKGFGPLFSPDVPASFRQRSAETILMRTELVEQHLRGSPYLMGENFSVADAYLFTVMNWANFVKLDISGRKAILGFMERTKARPAVQAALKAEGMLR
jgi:glutathione S-transferase